MERLSRNILLIGEEKQKKLVNANILLVGVGGVGGFVLEALVRAGIENITIVDKDDISLSNINRQIIALSSTVGESKVDVCFKRCKDINPMINIEKRYEFYDKDTYLNYDYDKYDYIIDCIDTITSKLLLIESAKKHHKKIISSMGCGNKLDYTKFKIDDISKTTVCPLARVVRQELRKRNIKDVKVLYSTEEPKIANKEFDEDTKKQIPGSISYIPSIAGLMIAGEVINDLIE